MVNEGSPPMAKIGDERGRRADRLLELALLFLRLGTTAFGGPAAHIALMEEEVVRRRGWLSREEFLDLLGATNLIPGPNSTELAIHIGHRRAGWPGLLVAGACFIIPAALMVSAIATVYVRYGRLPAIPAILYGVKPVIIAVVLQALWSLGRTAVRTWQLGILAVASAAGAFLGVNEIVLLLAAGSLAVAVRLARRPRSALPSGAFAPLLPGLAVTSTAAVAGAVKLSTLFFVFLKIGSVLFGSGYVLLAFLHADLVQRLHWLSEAQLLDAVAVGQITPGPVFTTATFVGYILAGPAGAAVATLGIFLPAFAFVAASGPLVPRIRRSALAGGFLDGVNVASLALMLVVSWQLGRATLVDAATVAIAVVALALLLWRRVSSLWLVLAGAAVGLALRGGLG
jgi:chromate transporter